MGQRFEEIDVERINIVDPDGTLRLTIANSVRQPDAVMDGKMLRSREGETSAGLIFFNEEGDECGGFQWSGGTRENGHSAGGGISFDQYKQDETITIRYFEDQNRRSATIRIQDRPTEVPISEVVTEELHPAMQLPDGEEKQQKIESIRSKFGGKTRVLLGRGEQGESALVLGDSQGRPRIRLYVDQNDTPRFEMLDEEGKVFFNLP